MNYNPDLGRGLIGDSRPGAFGPRALKRPRAKRAWSGIADQAPALGLDCIFPTYACSRTSELQKGSASLAGQESLAGLETTRTFSGKVCVKWKDSEFERQVRSESLNPLSSRRCKQPSTTVARRRELSSSNREVDKTPPGSADSLLSHVEITGDFDFEERRKPLSCLRNRQQSRSTHVPRTKVTR